MRFIAQPIRSQGVANTKEAAGAIIVLERVALDRRGAGDTQHLQNQ